MSLSDYIAEKMEDLHLKPVRILRNSYKTRIKLLEVQENDPIIQAVPSAWNNIKGRISELKKVVEDLNQILE